MSLPAARLLLHWSTCIAIPAWATSTLGAGDIAVECPAWNAEEQAAFEARARAELAVRGVSGTLSLHCAQEVTLRFAAPGMQPSLAQLRQQTPSVDEALELLASVLAPPPHSGTATGAASSNPTPETSPQTGQPGARAPGTGARAPGTEARSLGSGPQPQPSAAASSSPTPSYTGVAPRAAPPRDDRPSGTARGDDPRYALSVDAMGGPWGDTASLGLGGAAALVVHPGWALALDADARMLLGAPAPYAGQSVELGAGLRHAVTPELSLSASGAIGATWIYSRDRQWVLSEPDACSSSPTSALCWMFVGKVEVRWALGTGALRPVLGAEVAWLSRAVRISQGPDSDRAFSLPWIRPSVLLGVEWRDRMPAHAAAPPSSE